MFVNIIWRIKQLYMLMCICFITNSFFNMFFYFHRSASPETVLDCASMSNRQDQLYNSEFTKEKISAMTTV